MPKNIHAYSAYGFDPGLRHGAIIWAEYELLPQRHRLLGFQVIHQWKWKKKGTGDIQSKSTMPEVGEFVNTHLLSRFSKPSMLVGIEFSPNSVYWRTQKIQVVTLSFMLGYLTRGLYSQGLPVTYISVEQLKKAFNISPRETKSEYMSRPIQMVEAPPLDLSDQYDPAAHSDDVFDAFLISYLSAFLLQRILHVKD